MAKTVILLALLVWFLHQSLEGDTDTRTRKRNVPTNKAFMVTETNTQNGNVSTRKSSSNATLSRLFSNQRRIEGKGTSVKDSIAVATESHTELENVVNLFPSNYSLIRNKTDLETSMLETRKPTVTRNSTNVACSHKQHLNNSFDGKSFVALTMGNSGAPPTSDPNNFSLRHVTSRIDYGTLMSTNLLHNKQQTATSAIKFTEDVTVASTKEKTTVHTDILEESILSNSSIPETHATRLHHENRSYNALNGGMMRELFGTLDGCMEGHLADTCATTKFCSCNDACVLYDNCCVDAEPRALEEAEMRKLKRIKSFTTCEWISPGDMAGYTMVSSCPLQWTNGYVKFLCERRNNSNVASLVPVTETTSNITYRNTYCARCHGENNVQMWDARVERCTWFFSKWDADEEFLVNINKLLQIHPCRLHSTPVHSFEVDICFEKIDNRYGCLSYVRDDFFVSKTISNMEKRLRKSALAENGTVSDDVHLSKSMARHLPTMIDNTETMHQYFQLACQKYFNPAFDLATKTYFRNSLCQWCSNFRPACPRYLLSRTSHTLSILINFTAAIRQPHATALCGELEIFDRLHGICRRMFCAGGSFPNYGVCMKSYISVHMMLFRTRLYRQCSEDDDDVVLSFRMLFLTNYNYNQVSSYKHLSINKTTVHARGVHFDVCGVSCFDLRYAGSLTYDGVFRQENSLAGAYIRQLKTGNFVRLLNTSVGPRCWDEIPGGTNSKPLDCPYLKMNATEMADLDEKIKNSFAPPSAVRFLKADEGYVMCVSDYEIISKMILQQLKPLDTEEILTIALVTISVAGLTLSIITYIAHPELKSLSCRICLNIMTAQCVAYILFLLTPLIRHHVTICYWIAVLSHAAWLCTFMLMVFYAWDLCYVFSGNMLVACKSRHTSKCSVSVRSLLFIISPYVLSTIIILISLHHDLFNFVNAQYGIPTCFINNSRALLLYFGVPVILILSNNSAVFVIVTIRICKVTNQVRRTVRAKLSTYQSCVRMTVFLGLAWVFSILAAFTNEPALWFIHNVLNSSQGLFIFLFNVLSTRRVYAWYKNKLLVIKTRISKCEMEN